MNFLENLHISEIVAVLLAIYEALSRIVSTSKTWTIVGRVINVLKIISDYLDKKKTS